MYIQKSMLRIHMSSIFSVFPICCFNKPIYICRHKKKLSASAVFSYLKTAMATAVAALKFLAFAQLQFHISTYIYTRIRNAPKFPKMKTFKSLLHTSIFGKNEKSKWKLIRCQIYCVRQSIANFVPFYVATHHNNSIIFSCAAALSERRVFFSISLWWTQFCLHD